VGKWAALGARLLVTYIAWESNLKLITRLIEGVTVVHINGRIELGEGSAAVREVTQELIVKERRQILFDLADVEYIDSSGLGSLVNALTTVRKAGGELKLVNLTRKVQDLLQMTRLYTVFDVLDDETAAIKSFGPSATGSGV
jgi:anti-sigma B factor antagonist